jgi:hypothetical protein
MSGYGLLWIIEGEDVPATYVPQVGREWVFRKSHGAV